MITASCPECKEPILLASTPQIGQQLICANCKNDFEVTWLFPIILDYKENEFGKPSDPDDEPH